MKLLIHFGVALGIMLILDGMWLGLIAKSFYRNNLGHLISETPNWLAAAVFYVVFVMGILVFVVVPGWEHGGIVRVALYGAMFGFVTYATYDLTNQAVMKDWPMLVTVIDLGWGTFLTATVSVLTMVLGSKLTSGS